MPQACPLCDSQNAKIAAERQRLQTFHVTCATCGDFLISETVMQMLLQPEYKGERFRLSALTRRPADGQSPFVLLPTNIDDLLGQVQATTDAIHLLDQILLYIQQQTSAIGADVFVKGTDYPLFTLRSASDLVGCLTLLQDQGYIGIGGTIAGGGRTCVIKVPGWKRLAALRQTAEASSQAFVAMSFGKEMDSAWQKGFAPALREAGWDPYRVDRTEHNDKICDRIMADIRQSGLLVADFTGHKGGVYFEAGFALGLGIQVVWTVRKDDLENAHFDTRQYNHIDWQDPEDLRSRLYNRVVGTIGRPVRKSL